MTQVDCVFPTGAEVDTDDDELSSLDQVLGNGSSHRNHTAMYDASCRKIPG